MLGYRSVAAATRVAPKVVAKVVEASLKRVMRTDPDRS
jgi:hypothetical protein